LVDIDVSQVQVLIFRNPENEQALFTGEVERSCVSHAEKVH
jgi:hypothetical protein